MFMHFEVAGVILLVAIIAAVALNIAQSQGFKITRVFMIKCNVAAAERMKIVKMSADMNAKQDARGKEMTITLAHYLVLSAILFATSVIGIFLNRKNVIVLLMAIELMLLSVNINFVAFSHYLGDMAGQVFVFFILTVAAAEGGNWLGNLSCALP
jgi:NADH-quinone oxidoreductase subunit K